MSGLLNRAADELTELVAQGRDVAPVARDWLDEARRITHEDIPEVGSALCHAEQGRRLNVRAVGTPDMGPGLRQGFEALEHSALAVRSMFRAVVDDRRAVGLDVEMRRTCCSASPRSSGAGGGHRRVRCAGPTGRRARAAG